jgi:hypothetical protein
MRTLSYLWVGLLLVSLGLYSCRGSGGPDGGRADAAVVQAAPPPPSPEKELEELVTQAERDLPTWSNPDQLLELDRRLYDKVRALDPASFQVTRAAQVRRQIQDKLQPAYIDMAEASFKAGRYDDAERQAKYLAESASAELVKRKQTLLAKLPAILRAREACAGQWTLRACKLHEQHPDWSLKMCKSLYEEMVGLGMTPEMVKVSWGEPERVEQEQVKEGLQVTWFFARGAYVVFTGPNQTSLKATNVQN